MRDRKMIAIPILLIIALSVVGFTYALWWDYVEIRGKVEMAALSVVFDYREPPSCEEYWFNWTAGALQAGEYLDKDVGDPSCWYADLYTDPHTEKPGYRTLYILIDNAYPSYEVHTIFKLNNTGNMPANVTEYKITGEKRDAGGTKIYDLLWYDPDGDAIGELYEDVNGNGIVDGGDRLVINMEITNTLPYQLDPCHTNKAQIDLHFKQAAEECHTYLIKVTIVCVQSVH